MNDNNRPCCPADALRRIRQVKINGILTGITMLDECIADVKGLNLPDDSEVCEALMRKIRIYNYVPKAVDGQYTKAIMEEYRKYQTGEGI